MNNELDKAVALAEKPKAWCELTPAGSIAHFDGKPMVMVGPVGNEHHKTPLFTRQQVIEELANKTGVMPNEYGGLSRLYCYSEDVREAIATMQAKLEQQKEKHQELADRFWKSQGRVVELEKDAARWNKFREVWCSVESNTYDEFLGKLANVENENDVDAVIDAAMKGEQP